MSQFFLKEGTLVRIKNQLVKIEDVEPEMEVQSFSEHDRFFYHGIVDRLDQKQDCQFFSLKAGKREILATENTPLITSKGDGYIWMELSDFKKGNLMLIQNLTSTITFHEPIISIEKDDRAAGFMLSLKKYDNFVAEGFPIHTKPLPHPQKNKFFDF